MYILYAYIDIFVAVVAAAMLVFQVGLVLRKIAIL